MTYTISSLKTFRSLDGVGFSAILLADGRKVAEVLNEGTGGGTWLRWMASDKDQRAADEKALSDHIAAQPDYRHEYTGHMAGLNTEIFLDNMVDKIEREKEVRKLLKNKVVFVLPDSPAWRTLTKVKPTPEVLERAAKQFPTATFINTLSFEEAMTRFAAAE